jgi:hypothetical protein
MICTGMCLNGARTGLATMPAGLPSTRKGLERARPVWFAAASGPSGTTGTMPSSAGLRPLLEPPGLRVNFLGFRAVLAPGQ